MNNGLSFPSPTDGSPSGSEALTDGVRHTLAVTRRGCEELIPEADWAQKLSRAERTGTPLRIKLGLDPTAPDIHIGVLLLGTGVTAFGIAPLAPDAADLPVREVVEALPVLATPLYAAIPASARKASVFSRL